MSSTGKTSKPLVSELDARIPACYSRLIVAFSGGPDSTALLSLLSQLSHRRPLKIYAVYIDHAIRPLEERQEELRIVLKTAADIGVSLFCAFLPPEAIAGGRNSGGTEASARRERYAVLRRIAALMDCGAVCTAHTKEDQAETVLMRFLQGAGLEGLSGIPAAEGGILRPLLGMEKEALKAYLKEGGLYYSEDSTNSSEDYLRNAVRRRLMPVIKELFPGYTEGILAAAEKAGKAARALEAHVPLPQVKALRGGAYINASDYASLPQWGREEALFRLWNAVSRDQEYRLPYRFIREAAHQADCLMRLQIPAPREAAQEPLARQPLARQPARHNSVLARGHGIVIQKERNRIVCRSDVVSAAQIGYLVPIRQGRYRLWDRLECGIELLAAEDKEGQIPFSSSLGPYLLRSPREGDSMQVPGKGRKSVKEILYEHAVPATERGRAPVVENRAGIVAVCTAPWGGDIHLAAGSEAEHADGRIRLRFHYSGDYT